ncbi:MAG: sigma factor [Acidimicrobiales bacterium]
MLLDARSSQDAEDAVQDTLVRAWRARDRFEEWGGGIRSWPYRIKTDVCSSAWRSLTHRSLPKLITTAVGQPYQ